MQKRVDIYNTVPRGPQGDACGDACASCATWFEGTNGCCGWRVKRWLVCFALLFLMGIGLLVPFAIYAVWFGEASSCRLTYADDATISESEMQSWMVDERWPLSVPTYDWKRRTCVCKGFEDKDPKSLPPTDEVLVWIAPGDLASLSDEGAITPRLPSSFLDKYRGAYGEKDHVKVCLRQQLVLDLWNYDPSRINVADGGRHCHVSSSDGSSNVELFFLGWDGALYCASQTVKIGGSCGYKSDCMSYNDQRLATEWKAEDTVWCVNGICASCFDDVQCKLPATCVNSECRLPPCGIDYLHFAGWTGTEGSNAATCKTAFVVPVLSTWGNPPGGNDLLCNAPDSYSDDWEIRCGGVPIYSGDANKYRGKYCVSTAVLSGEQWKPYRHGDATALSIRCAPTTGAPNYYVT